LINDLLSYKHQVIDPVRGKPSAFLEMPPTVLLPKDDININLNSIYSILNIEEINLLGEISIGISKYSKAIDAINDRSRIHINELQPTLERAGVVQGGDYFPEQIETVLGNRLFVTIQQATQQVVDHVDNTLLTLQKVGNDLTSLLKKQFPGEKILEISIPNENNE